MKAQVDAEVALQAAMAMQPDDSKDSKASKAKRQKGQKKSDEKWETEHLIAFTDVGIDYPIDLERLDARFFRSSCYLPQRQRELAYYHTAVKGHGSDSEAVCDLNLSMESLELKTTNHSKGHCGGG